jgi:penicillin amidase
MEGTERHMPDDETTSGPATTPQPAASSQQPALGEQERAVLRRLLRGELTVRAAAQQAGVGRRDLARWRRAYLAEKLPPRDATVRLPVSAPVTIRWDTWGVPHISGETLRDLCVGLGYAMAQERLWQLDWLRRSARGELAAVLGREALEGDRAMRIIGIGRAADAAVAALSADEAAALAGLADGINAWLAQCGDRLPLEFDVLEYAPAPWRPADSVAILKYQQWLLTGRLENIAVAEAARRNIAGDLVAAFLATEEGQETIIPGPGAGEAAAGAETGAGSNNWALAPSRTTSGAAAVAADPHQPFHQPGQYFEAHLQGAGLDVAGAFPVGTPICAFGRNRRLAWGRTNHSVSVRDLYVEETEPGEPTRYREGDVWRSFLVEEQAIAIKGEATEYISVKRSVRGPIVSGLVPELEYWSGPPLSLRWVGLEPATGLQAALDLMRAGSVAEARAALRGWVLPVNNFVLADVDGQIAYQVAGRVPQRGDARRGYRKPAEPGDQWGEPYPFEQLPHELQPARGWVATANNPPWPADVPWVRLGVWADGYRMRRIRARLEERERHTLAEIGAIQADVVSGRAQDLAGRLAWWFRETGEPDLEQAALWLERWDCAYSRDAVGASIFEAFWRAWLERVADGRFPTRLVELVQGQCGALARAILLGRRLDWFSSRTVREQVRAAGREALRRLQAAAGPEMATWRWGRLHRVTWPHALGARPGLRRLNVGPFATGGGVSIVRAATHGDRPPFTVTGGSTYRFLADLGDPTRALSVSPTGQSGHAGSRHYRDQTRLWLADAYKPLWLDDSQIAANLEGTTVLVPEAAG